MRWFSEADLRRLAGPASFERGQGYLDSVASIGRVRGGIVATVHGQAPYLVRLTYEGGELAGTCSCPMGTSGEFCKHCVALGLIILDGVVEDADTVEGDQVAPAVKDDTVRAYLESLDQRALVELVWEQAAKDETLYRRLSLRASRQDGASPDVARIGKELDRALRGHQFLDYDDAPAYAGTVQDVLEELSQLLEEGYAEHVISLARRAIEQVAETIGVADDSDGAIGEVLDDLGVLHLDACNQAPPDPEGLARWLFHMELEHDWPDSVNVSAYKDLLGSEGLAVYRRLVETEWAKLPTKPDRDGLSGFIYGEADHRRWALGHMMEELASLSGDVDELVRVLARDLASGWQYLRIATALTEAGRDAEALAWAERGINATQDRPDPRLVDFTVTALARAGRDQDALALRRDVFARQPSLRSYQALWAAAEPLGCRDAERASAHQLLREQQPTGAGAFPYGYGGRNAVLVDVLVWEGDDEAAWTAATAGGCTPHTWRELVDRRAQQHPGEVIPIYQGFVTDAISRMNRDGYQHAADLLVRLHDLYARDGRPGEFAPYLARIRTEHKRKRNLMAALVDKGL